MADLKIIGKTTSKSRVDNGVQLDVTGTRDGAIYVCDYILAAAMEGKLFQVEVGTVTTPITFGAYDAQQPELVIDVPNGKVIIPVHIEVYLEDSAGTDNEIIAITCNNNVGAGTSTAVTPVSTYRNSGETSGCSVYSAYSANGTAPTSRLEFWRAGYPFADATTDPPKQFKWAYNSHAPQVIKGAGALVVYVSGTGTQANGFIKASYIELPSSAL